MRPNWAERDPNDEERRVLETGYNAFLENDYQWISNARLEALLRLQAGLSLERLLETMPVGLLWPDPAFGQHFSEEATTAVTVFGLTFVPSAKEDLALFVRVLGWAAGQRAGYLPPAEQGRHIQQLRLSELLAHLRAQRTIVEGDDVRRVLVLAQNEPFIPSLRGSTAEPWDQWEIQISRDVLAYEGITSIDDFFRRRPERPMMQRRNRLPDSLSGTPPSGGVAVTSSAEAPPIPTAQEPAELGVSPHAVSDLAASIDHLGFKPIVDGIADLVNAEVTALPLTVAITGAWGAGKSSLIEQLAQRLNEPARAGRHWRVIRFDAWKYERSETLWAALTKAIYEGGLAGQKDWRARFRFRTGLEVERHGNIWFARIAAVLLPLVAALGYGAWFADTQHRLGISASLLVIGAAVLALRYWHEASRTLADPFKRAIDLYTIRPRFESQLGFTSDAERDVDALIRYMTKNDRDALAIFVDDLDRCSPTHVVQVVDAVNQIFNASPDNKVLFVLGLDVDVVSASLRAAYHRTVRNLTARKETFGRDYLHKIAQLFVAVPEPTDEALGNLLSALSTDLPASPAQVSEAAVQAAQLEIASAEPSTLEETTARGDQLEAAARSEIERTAYQEASRRERAKRFGSDQADVARAEQQLLPYIARNPRALKHFDRAYRLQLHVANNSPGSKLHFEYDQLVALGKWVILSLRWPNRAKRLLSNPELMAEVEALAVAGNRDELADETVRGWFADPEFVKLCSDTNEAQLMSLLPLPSFLNVT